MVTKKKKNRNSDKKNIPSILFFVIAVLLFTFFLFSNINIAKKRLSLIKKIKFLDSKVAELKKRKEDLELGLSNTQTSDYWEGVVRDQGYVKNGEEAVVVLPSENQKLKENKNINFFQSFIEKIKVLFNQ